TRLVVREANTISVSSKNSLNFKARILPILMKFLYPLADAVIAVSEGVAKDLTQIIGLPAEKVKVIYNPVITPEIFKKAEEPIKHPWFAPGELPVILGVGRLTKQKDFITLIRAFDIVRKEYPSRLVILGEGEERPELEALVQELDLEQYVNMPGFVENPFSYMKKAAVFVLSSRWEGLPNVLIQALALGIPVVSTACPSGPTEILEKGKLGRLVPVGNEVIMAKAILEELKKQNKSGLNECVQNNIFKRFHINKITESYLTLIQGMDKYNVD
ncbi:MAG TPA: glycosyltransferase, partial [Tissierellaceae bacterium]